MKVSLPNSVLLKIAIFVIILGFGFYLFALNNFEMERFYSTIQETPPYLFFLIMTLAPLVGFPIAPFYLLAGSAYSWPIACAVCIASLAVNMVLAYPLGKYLLQAPLRKLLHTFEKKLPQLNSLNQFRVCFLVRTVPGIPYWLQNYLLASLGINFWVYLLISLSVQAVFATGMSALPHLAMQAGWVVSFIVAGIVLIFIIARRIFTSKTTSQPSVEISSIEEIDLKRD